MTNSMTEDTLEQLMADVLTRFAEHFHAKGKQKEANQLWNMAEELYSQR